MYFWLSLTFAIGFALIHYCSKYMGFLKETPRSKFLSISAGIAVAYVFVHLLPELNHYQELLNDELEHHIWSYTENHIYILALIGLILFYGLERLVKVSKQTTKLHNPDETKSGIFWIHMSSFFLYNSIIGYLLVREEYESPFGMLFYFIALGVHFVTNDRSLRSDHKHIYDKYGRLLLTGAILLGWIVGVMTELNELIISLLTAFIAGGIILNVMKEELPEERQSSIVSFLLGAAGYTTLLLLI
ncbi:ZIP family metal transporter [Terribacillus sp. DMT04]|uniref:ZIP family metal transporter n=1 Tax=Terribacillus sp. DMT04 TaxID=2850441 RepID=UPI001C2C1943|nr:ZIP family metal transporter [Terribacillus sp. DMT04]QXE01184.1 ZIP family metal transporter [Terribacillus sp. DMT04]